MQNTEIKLSEKQEPGENKANQLKPTDRPWGTFLPPADWNCHCTKAF